MTTCGRILRGAVFAALALAAPAPAEEPPAARPEQPPPERQATAEPPPPRPGCEAGLIATSEGCATEAEAMARVDAILRAGMERNHLKALIAGVSFDGRQELRALGFSMTGVPATPDMHFRNGAVAIAYLGTVLLQLAEKGTLALDAPLATWFPDYPGADRVTLEMLMNGTSGYADYVTDEGFIEAFYADPFRHWTPGELIAIGLKRPQACAPGACWSYAHTNFVILGQVIEKATGLPLAEVIRDGVLAPLALRDTRSEATAVIPEPVLHAYDGERGRYEESTFWDPSWTLAEGSVMTSTIADILTSAAAIGEGTLLSPASHARQLAPVTAKFEPWDGSMYYGLGVFVIRGWVVQNPSFAGYAATMAYLPDRKLGIAAAVTVTEAAPDAQNLSTDVAKAVAAYLAPEAPL
jgi:D-alanyl-D-alanine carboxypeptidase